PFAVSDSRKRSSSGTTTPRPSICSRNDRFFFAVWCVSTHSVKVRDMVFNRFGSRAFLFRSWSIALFGAGSAIGFWLGLASTGQARLLPPAVILAVLATVALVWLIRSRLTDHTHAVWNAYADREIAQARPGIVRRRR